MSKVIRLTPDLIEEMRQEFEKAINKPDIKLTDGRLTFTKNFNNTGEKATVYFTMEAWTKMFMVIQQFDKEVAWHGVCERHDVDGAHGYLIKDILVYPQTVTATTVEMDTEEYATWIQDNLADERFEHIHMQGHSHVRMAVSPSGTDLEHQREIVEYLQDDQYYIFMIYNKDLKSYYKIFDYGKNIMFEDTDITVSFLEGVVGLDEFMKDAKTQVKNRAYASGPSGYSTNNYPATGGYSGGVNGYSYTGSNVGTAGKGYQNPNSYNPVKPTATPVTTTPAVKSATTTTTAAKPATTQAEKPKTVIGAGWAGRNAVQSTAPKTADEMADDYYSRLFDSQYGSTPPYYD